MVECTRLESEQTLKGLGSSNLPLSATGLARGRIEIRREERMLTFSDSYAGTTLDTGVA